jgi:hypothetical protein
LSLICDMYALRLLGAAREAAIFATAPFIGALLSLPLLGDRPTVAIAAAAALMLLGLGLLVRERHAHTHEHAPLEHDHLHTHDEHHLHEHEGREAVPALPREAVPRASARIGSAPPSRPRVSWRSRRM